MDELCLKTITRIRAESPRLKCRDLKTKSDEYIVFFTKQVENLTSKGTKSSSPSRGDGDEAHQRAEDYFDVFQLAFESRFPRVIEVALEGLNSLIEGGYLLGDSPVTESLRAASIVGKNSASGKIVFKDLFDFEHVSPQYGRGADTDDEEVGLGPQQRQRPVSLMEHLVEVISLVAEVETDEVVQANLLKLFLTIATTSHLDTHGRSLLLAIRGCFHINITTWNAGNKTQSKTNIENILKVFNVRMESGGLSGAGGVGPIPSEALFALGLTLRELNALNEENERIAVALERERVNMTKTTTTGGSGSGSGASSAIGVIIEEDEEKEKDDVKVDDDNSATRSAASSTPSSPKSAAAAPAQSGIKDPFLVGGAAAAAATAALASKDVGSPGTELEFAL